MADPIPALHAQRVVRINQRDLDNLAYVERLLQPLYLIAEPIVDLSGIEHLVSTIAGQLKHLNRYHTSKGGERLRVVTGSSNVRKTLGGPANVFRFYESLEEALSAAI